MIRRSLANALIGSLPFVSDDDAVARMIRPTSLGAQAGEYGALALAALALNRRATELEPAAGGHYGGGTGGT